MPNGRNGLEKLVPSRGRSHLIAPVADAKQCNTMPTKLERTSLSGQVYFRTKFGNTSLSAQCKHRQSQMPLFGIQIFLSKAETGRIYSHQIYTFVYVIDVLKHRRNLDVEIVATHVMSTSAKHVTVNIGCKDITSIISRYFRTAGTWRGIFEPSTVASDE